jgi:transposase
MELKQQRKQYRPDEKVALLRRHLLDGEAVSDLCDEQDLQPTVFYRWQKEFFEGGAAAFDRERKGTAKRLEKRIAELEAELGRRNEVLAEVTEAFVRCQKKPLAR